MRRILIVEDDLTFSLMLKTWLEKKSFEAVSVSSIEAAMDYIEKNDLDVVITDMRLPDGEGISLLEWGGRTKPSLPFIVMTGYADVRNAVSCMKMGAVDYITKPIDPEDLLTKLNSIGSAAASKPVQAVKSARTVSQVSDVNDYVEGNSPAARKLYEHLKIVAPTNISVIIRGASGTGKEHLAKLIHNNSTRKGKPFIAVDCGSIPKDLAGSEFFGHKKGSFTGAITDKKGAFTEANGGTLFLDEVGNLSYDVQVQLLRAIQERKIRPIGSNTEIDVDIRLITATNENLEDAIRSGEFREDLFHRLNGFALDVPELKDQVVDIPKYAEFFLRKSNEELGKQVKGFEKETMEILESYSWPGNLRQMKNAILSAVLLTQGEYVAPEYLPSELRMPEEEKGDEFSLYNKEDEKQMILKALESTGYNKSKAAKLLKIDRKTLYNKMKALNIE